MYSGRHWYAAWAYIDGFQPKIDICCSYATLIENLNTKFPFPIKNVNKIILQPLDSKKCGYYSLYYLRMRSKGFTHFEALERFTPDLKLNDKIVKSYFKSVCKNFNISERKSSSTQNCCSRLENLNI
jgi:hypothetical protein